MRLLEGRLVDLDYRLVGTADGRYDFRTADAVVAFHKVQRMDRSNAVSVATWRRLADPIRPHPREWQGFHFEVDQSKQVLYARWRMATSRTCSTFRPERSGLTRDGAFRVRANL